MSCVYFICLPAAIVLIALALREAGRERDSFGARSPTILGVLAAFFGFFFMTWIEVTPARYVLNFLPEVFQDVLPETLVRILELLHQQVPSSVLSFVVSLIGIPGWLLLLALPSTDWFVRLVMLFVPIVCSISIIWLVWTIFFPLHSLRRPMGILQACFAFLTALFLLLEIPNIDALANDQTLIVRFIAVILGIRIGPGIWLAWIGLVLIGFGGLMEMRIGDGSGNLREPSPVNDGPLADF